MSPCSEPKPFRERIRHFTPAWHAVNMGTGAISALFHTFPYGSNSKAMQYIALFFLLLNLVLFTVLFLCGIARYTFFRGLWSTMMRHPVQSLYLGTFPMGFATIIMAAVGIVHGYFNFGGDGLIWALWALWWADVAVSIAIAFGQLHFMMTRHDHKINSMTSIWLLPIVTLIVAAATGAIVGQALFPIDVSRACLTLGTSLFLCVIGISLALMVIVIYLQRLILHGLPQGLLIFSVYLPLGPLGQSGYAFLTLGQTARMFFPLMSGGEMNIFADSSAPHVVYAIAWVISFALWSLATAWVALAVLALADTLRKGLLPFKITFWGMIFPNGVYANLTIQLGLSIDSGVLKVWGAIYAIFTFALWIFAFGRTLPSVWDGSIFEAPCIGEADMIMPRKHTPSTVESTATTVTNNAGSCTGTGAEVRAEKRGSA
ncbi:hypothetical protein SCHPADRAFT_924438 [Schizopora paradoxa]|uniref:C4-dicarboxylate transporter/malic acid transport protein n=1 Tax=Schizopora paradoxa TaxID=27342 RepID=A0A0H2SCQ8_9AGAM|nr:hypothetical protein SCHPADRAFT_924438 [Schizopora paradoxa]